MFYKKPTRWNRFRRYLSQHTVVRILVEMAAGINAASGIAHGIEPPPSSRARNHHRE
ncbi:MAG: hypothetical protein WBB07_25260 [Mycobacterium sp.]